MLITKSYQNCTETEVPGYNDCPSFLFMPNRPSARKKQHRVVSEHRNTNNSTSKQTTNVTTAAPPILNRKQKEVAKQEEDESNTSLSKDEILHKVNEIYVLKSKLVNREFEFYKKKVDNSLVDSLEDQSTRAILTRFFYEASTDKSKASNTLRTWMTSDVSILNWCPAFLKIFEHTEFA